jgi:hypothetical protein
MYILVAIAVSGSTIDMRMTVFKGRWKVDVDFIALGVKSDRGTTDVPERVACHAAIQICVLHVLRSQGTQTITRYCNSRGKSRWGGDESDMMLVRKWDGRSGLRGRENKSNDIQE